MLKQCLICRNDFERPYRRSVEDAVLNVCSEICFVNWLNSIDFEFDPKISYVFNDTKGAYRSSFEERFADWLSQHQQVFFFEPLLFKLNTGKFYLPDFLLSNGLFVEVKGVWEAGAKPKFKSFYKDSGLKIILVDEDFLRLINA